MSVITNTSKILKLVSDNEPCSLKFLTTETGMKKPTLFLTLKLLVEVNYLSKDNNNLYSLGKSLIALGDARFAKKDLMQSIREIALNLRDKTGETVVISTIQNIYYEKLLSINSTHTITVNESVFSNQTFYTSATGRAMLAVSTDDLREKIFKESGLPVNEDWQGIKSFEHLNSELNIIRDAGYTEVLNSNGQAVFVAFPLTVKDRILAVGLSIPAYRYSPEYKKEVLRKMKFAVDALFDKLLTVN